MAEINFEKAYYDLKGKYDIALKIIDNQKKIEENNQKIINALEETISWKDKQIESRDEVMKATCKDEDNWKKLMQYFKDKYFNKEINKTEAG